MVERKFKEGYSAPELKELEKELDKRQRSGTAWMR